MSAYACSALVGLGIDSSLLREGVGSRLKRQSLSTAILSWLKTVVDPNGLACLLTLSTGLRMIVVVEKGVKVGLRFEALLSALLCQYSVARILGSVLFTRRTLPNFEWTWFDFPLAKVRPTLVTLLEFQRRLYSAGAEDDY